jgi:FMN reductase
VNDPQIRVVGISGSPSVTSRSRLLLALGLEAFARLGAGTRLIDLARLPSDALLGRSQSADLDSARRDVLESRVVVVSTPVYRATYSGLLKVFLDLLPQGALNARICAGIATGASPSHASVLEFGLRPLLTSLDAIVPWPGVYALESEFTAGQPGDAPRERLTQLVTGLFTLATAGNRAASPAVEET